jgi:RNA polymerase sigma-70 factor (ECF subfamily)
MTPKPTQASFPTTRWSQVARAGEPDALAALCAAYWYPIYAFIRRGGHDADAAYDLAQAYFTRLLETRRFHAADPARGRLRSFLRTDCAFFLADQRDREKALRRGGGVSIATLDADSADARYRHEPAHAETPDRLFDRAWALALLDRAMDAVGRHYAATGRGDVFQRLRPGLVPSSGEAATHADIAATLGMTPGAVQVAAHRMRTRFAAALRKEIAATLDDPTPSAIDEEIRGLFAVLAS